MGTRSTTIFWGEEIGTEPLVKMYKQYDGYPSGLGQYYVEKLGGTTLRNGYGMGDKAPLAFNGMECLAAWIVGDLKGGEIGGIYLMSLGNDADKPNGIHGDCGQDYLYDIYQHDGKINIRCRSAGWDKHKPKVLYDGPVADWVIKED